MKKIAFLLSGLCFIALFGWGINLLVHWTSDSENTQVEDFTDGQNSSQVQTTDTDSNSEIYSDLEESDDRIEEIKVIEGKDFVIRYASPDENLRAEVTFYNKEEESIKKFITESGEIYNTENLIWKGDQVIQKSPWIEKIKSELVTTKSKERLPQGQGLLGSESILMIKDKTIYEVLHVTVDRTIPNENDQFHLNYKASLNCHWENLNCDLDYKLNKDSGQIKFQWDTDKQKFTDPSGQYQKILEQLEI